LFAFYVASGAVEPAFSQASQATLGGWQGPLLESMKGRRQVHGSTLGRTSGGVRSNGLLDFAGPVTRATAPGYPIGLAT
jgi:hypothetical protein